MRRRRSRHLATHIAGSQSAPRENPPAKRRAQPIEEISPPPRGIAGVASRPSRAATPRPKVLSHPERFLAPQFCRASPADRRARRIPIRRPRAAIPALRESERTPPQARPGPFQTPERPRPFAQAHTWSSAAAIRAACQIRVHLGLSVTFCFSLLHIVFKESAPRSLAFLSILRARAQE